MFGYTGTERTAQVRTAAGPAPMRVIAVAGGKGGVGKTTVAINLAIAAAQRRRNVWLLDGNLALGDVGTALGLVSDYDLSHVLAGERTLGEIVIPGPAGVKIVPAAFGNRHMAELGDAEYAGLIHAFSEVAPAPDVLVVDTPAGIGRGVTTVVSACQDVAMVVCDEPASIADACALMTILSRHHGHARFRVLANMAGSERQGRDLFATLVERCTRFPGVTLEFAGSIPYDAQLRKAARRQRAVMDLYPDSCSARAFSAIAASMDAWVCPECVDGRLQFFFERLLSPPRDAGGVGA